jgi:hypothetical protein
MTNKARLSKPRTGGKPKLATARGYALLAFALGGYMAFVLLRPMQLKAHKEGSYDSETLVHFFFHDVGKLLCRGSVS